MYMNLAMRGPITAISCLVAAASFSAGAFFVALRNTALDCATGSATHAACGIDVLETIVSALIVIGTVAGATAVGAVTPTPRDLSASAIFRVDGKEVNWVEGMENHRFGMNRTIDNPARVEYQHNSTSAIHKYLSYQTAEGHLVVRHPTGFQVPTGSTSRLRSLVGADLFARSTCEAYIDTVIYGDSLRGGELSTSVSYEQYLTAATDFFNYYVDNNYQAGCIALSTNVQYHTLVDMGASCGNSIPGSGFDCYRADFTTNVYNIIV